MAANINEELQWFTVFRMDENDGWLYQELTAGRLRQGWGAHGCTLLTADGQRVEKADFEEGYREAYGKEASPRRFAILTGMLDLNDGDVVVVPKMPEMDQFTIARVSQGYAFDTESGLDDYRHIVYVYRESVRTFDYRTDEDTYLISGLFARANHQAAISFCYTAEQIAATLRLLRRPNDLITSQSDEAFFRTAIDDAFRLAAIRLRNQIKNWNGTRFELAVRHAFLDQGYTIIPHRHYDGQGADADILVSPPASRYGVFLPGKIAVQVKWKQGVDEDDSYAVSQIIKWAKSQGSDAVKCVISSASEFTIGAQKLAADEDVMLICGLQTMCFILGVADRYRDDWDSLE